MSILSDIFSGGVGGVVSPITDLIGKVIEKIFPDPEQANKAKLALLELEQQGELAQLAVNLAEAQHESVFVAGWRPFIGWVGGFALAYKFIIQPFTIFFVNAIGLYTGHPIFDPALLPEIDDGSLITILLGMLGLGGLRTFEKWSGTNMNRTGAPSGGQ